MRRIGLAVIKTLTAINTGDPPNQWPNERIGKIRQSEILFPRGVGKRSLTTTALDLLGIWGDWFLRNTRHPLNIVFALLNRKLMHLPRAIGRRSGNFGLSTKIAPQTNYKFSIGCNSNFTAEKFDFYTWLYLSTDNRTLLPFLCCCDTPER